MSKHTPGPWEWDPTGDIGWWQIGQPGGKPVATIEHDPVFQFAKGEAMANARLIAAAPDLLDIARAIGAWQDGSPLVGGRGVPADIAVALRAAIAKAEGRS